MGHGVAFGMGVGGWWPWRTDRGRPAARGARAVALISGSGLGLVVELVSVGEVGRAGLQGLRLDLGIRVGAGVELGLGVELVAELVPSGAAGRAGGQGRGLQGQAGGLGVDLVAEEAIRDTGWVWLTLSGRPRAWAGGGVMDTAGPHGPGAGGSTHLNPPENRPYFSLRNGDQTVFIELSTS
jgi:hypothetical protein